MFSSDLNAKKQMSFGATTGKDKSKYNFPRGFQEARGSVKKSNNQPTSDTDSKIASEFTEGNIIKKKLINENNTFNYSDSVLLKNIDAIITKEGGYD